jgi:hypothetical protein
VRLAVVVRWWGRRRDRQFTYTSIADFVKDRVKNVAEVEDAEVEDEIAVDTLEGEVGGF